MESIQSARRVFTDATPLKSDCGMLCGSACCQDDPLESSGMILFPGEEALYDPAPDWAVITYTMFEGKPVRMLRCVKPCPRCDRPLACMMFPLIPVMIDGKPRVRADRRAFAVCPLAGQGSDAFDPAFVTAVKEAARLLAADEDCARYLHAMADHQRKLSSWKSILE